MSQFAAFPTGRPRRLRAHPSVRRLVSETTLEPRHLVLPLFVGEHDEPQAIASMPGVVRHSSATLVDAVADAARLGLGGVMLFGVPALRDATGSEACRAGGVLNTAISAVRDRVGDDLVVMADLCLDEFTDHGHCGVLDDSGWVDNDRTLDLYAEMARAQASAGAHLLGTSGMMDGQVAAVRAALDDMGATDVGILAYAAKYASALYGPFRDAVDVALGGDRRTYQMDPGNRREALLEGALDVAEGADIVMVKPATSYLDVLADLRAATSIPVAAYQVSGEYSMIAAAGERGWVDAAAVMIESLVSIRRAGADIVLTYAAAAVAKELTA